MVKSGIFAGIMLAAASAALTGCGQEQPTAPTVRAERSMTVENARLALPPVKRNPGAVYFDLVNTGKTDMAVRTAEVEGAQAAMLHAMNGGSMDDLMLQPVKAGETVKFEPGGRHVMAMGLPDSLQPGGSVKVTLHFGNGDKLEFPAEVIAPGDER